MLSDLSKAEDVLDFNNYGTILTFIYAIYYFTLSIPLAVSSNVMILNKLKVF